MKKKKKYVRKSEEYKKGNSLKIDEELRREDIFQNGYCHIKVSQKEFILEIEETNFSESEKFKYFPIDKYIYNREELLVS